MDRTDRILVVEDDTDLLALIRIAGEQRTYTIAVAHDGLEAKELLGSSVQAIPDLIILDINMPRMDGYSFCRWLRDTHPLIPVIFLSARADEYDKIIALELGGDDYLTKPFSMKELFARVAVCLRRVRQYRNSVRTPNGTGGVSTGNLTIDAESWSCAYRGQPVVLTISEFRILSRLVETPDAVVNREKLAAAAFPDDQYNSGRSIDIHIYRIRQKLTAIDPDFDSLKTVYQLGYKWTD